VPSTEFNRNRTGIQNYIKTEVYGTAYYQYILILHWLFLRKSQCKKEQQVKKNPTSKEALLKALS